jgi:hypothetical protein
VVRAEKLRGFALRFQEKLMGIQDELASKNDTLNGDNLLF